MPGKRSTFAIGAELHAQLAERDAFISQLSKEINLLKRHVSRTPAGHDVLLRVSELRTQWWQARHSERRL